MLREISGKLDRVLTLLEKQVESSKWVLVKKMTYQGADTPDPSEGRYKVLGTYPTASEARAKLRELKTDILADSKRYLHGDVRYGTANTETLFEYTELWEDGRHFQNNPQYVQLPKYIWRLGVKEE